MAILKKEEKVEAVILLSGKVSIIEKSVMFPEQDWRDVWSLNLFQVQPIVTLSAFFNNVQLYESRHQTVKLNQGYSVVRWIC